MFDTLRDGALGAVSWLLALFYSLPVVGGSYGIAIILLTLTVMVFLMPLTLRATRSQIKMTQLQPEMRALQKRYKNDKQELNQELMKLYQEHGVNPVGGCLPILAQLPVFLVLFNVLRGLARRVDELPYFALSEQAHSLIGSEIEGAENFDPANLGTESVLYQDLINDSEMLFGPFDLAVNAGDVVRSNPFGSIVYIILIAFVVGSSYYQQRQISARRDTSQDESNPQLQTQQQLLKIIPLMSGVWSFFFPAGLVIYWATSNAFRIGQQAYITRSLYSGDGPGANPPVFSEPDDDEAQDDVVDAKLVGGGKPGRNGSNNKSKKSSERSPDRNSKPAKDAKAKNGSSSDDGKPVDRGEAWAQRRAERAKVSERKRAAAPDGSSRVTPKGTKPSSNKKKRKR